MAFSAAYCATLPEPEINTRFAFNAVVAGFQHGLGKIHASRSRWLQGESGCRPHSGPLPVRTEANSLRIFVLAEQIADFAAAYADVAGRNVGIGADVAVEFGHNGLGRAHYFGIGFAFRIKVGTICRRP